jgi:hypothetical protein
MQEAVAPPARAPGGGGAGETVGPAGRGRRHALDDGRRGTPQQPEREPRTERPSAITAPMSDSRRRRREARRRSGPGAGTGAVARGRWVEGDSTGAGDKVGPSAGGEGAGARGGGGAAAGGGAATSASSDARTGGRARRRPPSARRRRRRWSPRPPRGCYAARGEASAASAPAPPSLPGVERRRERVELRHPSSLVGSSPRSRIRAGSAR